MRAAIIVLAALWIYAPVYHGDWLWDDDTLLTQNATVQSGSLAGLAKLWFNPDGQDYFPLSYSALWTQWLFFGKNPTGYHVTSILLHIGGSLLLWMLLARMKIPGAWLSGLVFAIHPACVESVAWMSEIKNTLSLPLFLLSAVCWVEQDDEPDRPRQTRLYGLSLVFFLLAMYAKTSVVALPVVTLLYAWWKRGMISRQDVVRAVPMFAISLALGLITISYQHGRAIGEETIPVGGIAARIATAGMAIFFYLATILWPVNLLPIYPRWEVDPPKLWQLLPWPIIAGAAAWFWTQRGSWGRHALFAFGFFLLMVLPVLGFITISYMRITWVADHFIYLPMIGPIALGAAAVTASCDRLQETMKPTFVTFAALLLAICGLLSFRYTRVWVDEDNLWTYTLTHNHDAWQAHNRLGARKLARRDIEAALYHFTHATRIRPDLSETHNNRGLALAAGERPDEAIIEFSEAFRLAASWSRVAVYTNLANTIFKTGRYTEAVEAYEKLVEMAPENPTFHNNLGVSLYKTGNRQEAVRQFRRALELKPDFKPAQEGLTAASEAESGRSDTPQP